MQTLHPDSAHQLAQELVEKTRQIKSLLAEVDLLKLEIFDAAQGGIQCSGGRIFFVESGTSLQFDHDRLKNQLVQQFDFSDQQVAAFIESCKSERGKAAYISVYLD